METIKTYRLEYNENQMYFHLDDYTHEPNTNGWFTIAEHCTDIEFQIFNAYLNRIKNGRIVFEKEYLLKSISEVTIFLKNLAEYGLIITKA